MLARPIPNTPGRCSRLKRASVLGTSGCVGSRLELVHWTVISSAFERATLKLGHVLGEATIHWA